MEERIGTLEEIKKELLEILHYFNESLKKTDYIIDILDNIIEISEVLKDIEEEIDYNSTYEVPKETKYILCRQLMGQLNFMKYDENVIK